ncbi:hypothetical protein Fmac_030212 [Flemingia macrophylla]|uniref:Secreted protein n=1 Tax=Flemingia macrophylla TaxID=520843 RepID=A0ABD1LD39_9FABA
MPFFCIILCHTTSIVLIALYHLARVELCLHGAFHSWILLFDLWVLVVEPPWDNGTRDHGHRTSIGDEHNSQATAPKT